MDRHPPKFGLKLSVQQPFVVDEVCWFSLYQDGCGKRIKGVKRELRRCVGLLSIRMAVEKGKRGSKGS